MLETIRERQIQKDGVFFIAIDGHGGSGKSTLAELLAIELSAEIIHTDDFASWDNPTDWWPLVIEQVLKPIQAGAKALSYQRSKWSPEHTPEPVIGQPVTDIMILEGVSSLRREFSNYIDLGIFVDTPRKICLQRGVERDLTTGNVEEVRKQWKEWMQEEDEYMARDNPKAKANFVLDGMRPFKKQLGLARG